MGPIEDDIWEATNRICDKCGREVAPGNDMTLVMGLIPGCEIIPTVWKSRHMLPVVEDGVQVCPGSPSRAQYIEDQPRDTRGYPYLKELEKAYREAWAELQRRLTPGT